MNALLLPRLVESIPLDEKVWHSWLDKNRQEEKTSLARQLRITVILSPILLAAVLMWLLKSS
jgi:hypothetical protein